MRISDWSSDVCSSDLGLAADHQARNHPERGPGEDEYHEGARSIFPVAEPTSHCRSPVRRARGIWHERRQMSQIGRASCRERGCPLVMISVVAVTIKNTHQLLIAIAYR